MLLRHDPVRYTYDITYGWMTEMKTYRDTTGADALIGTAAAGGDMHLEISTALLTGAETL